MAVAATAAAAAQETVQQLPGNGAGDLSFLSRSAMGIRSCGSSIAKQSQRNKRICLDTCMSMGGECLFA